MASSMRLSEFHDVVVRISVPGASAPRLLARPVDNFGAGGHRSGVGALDVVNSKTHLGTGGVLTFALVEREVEECPVRPGCRSVAAADPTIVLAVPGTFVVRHVQIEPESVPIQRGRAVEIGDLEYHCHETCVL